LPGVEPPVPWAPLKRSSLIALAAVLLLLVVGLVWFLGKGPSRSLEVPETGTAPVAESKAPLATGESVPERDAIPAEAPLERAAVVPIVAAEEDGKLAGRVVDSAGAGVAGAEIVAYLRPIEAREYLLDRAYRKEKTKVAATRSNDKGEFALDLPTGRPHELRARAVGFAEAVAEGATVGIPVTISMHRAAAIEGTVTRKPEGTPIAGARVIVLGGEEPAWEGETDGTGRFRAEGLDAGEVMLQVIPEDATAATLDLELKEGERLVHDVALETGFVVTGEVRDAVSGAPIEGAEVSSWSFYAKTVRTDASGQYTLAGIRGDSAQIAARAPGHGRFEQTILPVANEILRADFDLARTRSARGRLVARDGSPLAGAYVAAYAHVDAELARDDLISTRSGDDGRFELADLRPDLPHALFVRRMRYATLIQSMPNVEAAIIELGDVVLPPGSTLHGVVVDAENRPQEGVHVWIEPQGSGFANASVLEHRSVTTDARGGFLFRDLAAGHHSLRVVKQGTPIPRETTVWLAEGEVRKDLWIVLSCGLPLEGRVVDARGAAIAAARIQLTPAWKDGPRVMTAESAEDGAFSFVGLPDGAYTLTGAGEGFVATTIEDVSAGAKPITVQLARAAEVKGIFRAADGTPFARALVVAFDAQGKRVASDRTDSLGHFRLEVAVDTTVDLAAWVAPSDTEATPEAPPFLTKPGVRAGTTDVILSPKP
jgi:hypothetical protein